MLNEINRLYIIFIPKINLLVLIIIALLVYIIWLINSLNIGKLTEETPYDNEHLPKVEISTITF